MLQRFSFFGCAPANPDFVQSSAPPPRTQLRTAYLHVTYEVSPVCPETRRSRSEVETHTRKLLSVQHVGIQGIRILNLDTTGIPYWL